MPERERMGVQKPILLKLRFLIFFVEKSTVPATDSVRIPIAGL
jgi:hypothetical protein